MQSASSSAAVSALTPNVERIAETGWRVLAWPSPLSGPTGAGLGWRSSARDVRLCLSCIRPSVDTESAQEVAIRAGRTVEPHHMGS